jgi:hypothetical protein
MVKRNKKINGNNNHKNSQYFKSKTWPSIRDTLAAAIWFTGT